MESKQGMRALCLSEPAVQNADDALVGVEADQTQMPVPRRVALDHHDAVVGRRVVDDDDFLGLPRLGEDRIKAPGQEAGMVIIRNDD